jgi:hypothetical protein
VRKFGLELRWHALIELNGHLKQADLLKKSFEIEQTAAVTGDALEKSSFGLLEARLNDAEDRATTQ